MCSIREMLYFSLQENCITSKACNSQIKLASNVLLINQFIHHVSIHIYFFKLSKMKSTTPRNYNKKNSAQISI